MLTTSALRPAAAPRTACFTRRAVLTHRVAPAVRCSAEKDWVQKAALPAAALLGAALLFAATPDEALAARSGGRVGGASFSSRPRSAPAPRSSAGPSVRNYNYYSAPPLMSPWGFGSPFGYGFGGVSVFPMFGLGTIFNIFILMFIANVVLNTVRNFTEGGNKDGRADDSDDDDRW